MDNPKRIPIDLRFAKAIKSALFGVAVGDALGVPAEFKTREFLRENPVTDMTGHGTHHQPPGTFSDDSSLTFCLAEALTEEFDLHTIARNFVRWRDEGFWTAHGFVFDIGGTTSQAIGRLRKGIQPDLAGDSDAQCNGNGSLMRILPLLFHLHDKPARSLPSPTATSARSSPAFTISNHCCPV